MAEIILLKEVANELVTLIHKHLNQYPEGEIKGVLAAIPMGEDFIGFKTIITHRNKNASVTSKDAEENLFYELTTKHPDVKFIPLHSHPDGFHFATKGDVENFQLVYIMAQTDIVTLN